jgi:hypothetical protein
MLGFITKYGASKGMVVVPNLLGLSSTAANNQMASVGLKTSLLSGSVPTNVSAQGGVSLSQVPAPGTLVDYETEIVVGYGNFIADTINVSGCESYPGSSSTSGGGCSGTLTLYATTTTGRRKTVSTTNNITGVTTISHDYSCTSTSSGGGSAYVDGSCDYTTPPKNCTASTTVHVPWGACSGGTQSRTMYKITSTCVESYPIETRCCQTSTTVVYGPWIADTHSRTRSVTTTDTKCNVTITYETVCSSRTTTAVCGKCTKSGTTITQTCNATKINSDCTTTPISYTQKCT